MSVCSENWEYSEVSALSDRLNAARGERSIRSIGRAATKVNGTGESTVIPYFNGKHGTPSIPVLDALAEVLSVPISELREAAGLPAGERLPYEPPIEAALLSRRQRQAVDELIRSIVETQGATHANNTTSIPDRQAQAPRASRGDDEGQKTSKPTDLSARRASREALPEELPPEDISNAWAARTRDPQFPPDIPDDDGIGEENQDDGGWG